jgi:hypothetical protein
VTNGSVALWEVFAKSHSESVKFGRTWSSDINEGLLGCHNSIESDQFAFVPARRDGFLATVLCEVAKMHNGSFIRHIIDTFFSCAQPRAFLGSQSMFAGMSHWTRIDGFHQWNIS